MYRRGLNLALAVAMLVASIPHALCACEHATAGNRVKAPACPFCHVHPMAPKPYSPHERCPCGACEVIPAVPSATAVSVPSPAPSTDHAVLDLLPSLDAAFIFRAEPRAARSVGPSAYAGRAIPIFLGHLLF